jgi:uncharacterized lipoprotein NlpE involved in copper resistance
MKFIFTALVLMFAMSGCESDNTGVAVEDTVVDVLDTVEAPDSVADVATDAVDSDVDVLTVEE